MDTKAPLLIIISLGIAVAMWQASGGAAILGNPGPTDDLKSGETINNASGDASVDDGYGGQVDPQSDSDIVGVILGSLGKFIALLAVPGVLSFELARLGLWWWAAAPLGVMANIVVYIGGFQVVTGRTYE